MNRLDNKLLDLNTTMLEMSRLVERAIEELLKAIKEEEDISLEHFNSVYEELDSLDKQVQNTCLRMLLEFQPVAGDFRKISSALKMVTDINRIGNQCINIARIISEMSPVVEKDLYLEIFNIATYSKDVVKSAIYSFIKNSYEDAEEVTKKDDAVDEEFINIKNRMIKRIQNGDLEASMIVDIIIIAKYFERIADHGSNIAKWVKYSTGGTIENSNN